MCLDVSESTKQLATQSTATALRNDKVIRHLSKKMKINICVKEI